MAGLPSSFLAILFGSCFGVSEGATRPRLEENPREIERNEAEIVMSLHVDGFPARSASRTPSPSLFLIILSNDGQRHGTSLQGLFTIGSGRRRWFPG